MFALYVFGQKPTWTVLSFSDLIDLICSDLLCLMLLLLSTQNPFF